MNRHKCHAVLLYLKARMSNFTPKVEGFVAREQEAEQQTKPNLKDCRKDFTLLLSAPA